MRTLKQSLSQRRILVSASILGILGIAVGVAFLVLGGGGGRAAATGTGVPSYCDPAMPHFTVVGCESSHSALEAQAKAMWPTDGTTINASSAQQVADGAVESATRATAGTNSIARPHVVAAYEQRATYSEAGRYMEATNPFVAPSTPVWIVTTRWSSSFDVSVGLRASTVSQPPYTTTIIDAVSGKPIDSCSGCDVVQPDGRMESQLP